MLWYWLAAMITILLCVVLPCLVIDDDEKKILDKTRDAWWPDDGLDKGKREHESSFIQKRRD